MVVVKKTLEKLERRSRLVSDPIVCHPERSVSRAKRETRGVEGPLLLLDVVTRALRLLPTAGFAVPTDFAYSSIAWIKDLMSATSC